MKTFGFRFGRNYTREQICLFGYLEIVQILEVYNSKEIMQALNCWNLFDISEIFMTVMDLIVIIYIVVL